MGLLLASIFWLKSAKNAQNLAKWEFFGWFLSLLIYDKCNDWAENKGYIFHLDCKVCNIWLNIIIDLSCIGASFDLLYMSAGEQIKQKVIGPLSITTYRQKCLSYICIVIFQQRESLRSDPGAFLMYGTLPALTKASRFT